MQFFVSLRSCCIGGAGDKQAMKTIPKILALGAIGFCLALSAGSVVAQNDPIAQRKALMKAIGDSGRAPAAMLKGELPFDLAAVQSALKAMQDAGKQSPALYPETSKTGGDTAALPKIWESNADFKAKLAKLESDATSGLAKITDEASFKASYPDILRSCGDCHRDYRARR